MALHILTPPPESEAALTTALHVPHPGPVGGMRAFLASGPTKEVTLPHPVYVLGLDSLAHGAGLSDAKLTSWRYLVGAAGKHELAAEVRADPQSSRHAFSSFNEGVFVEDTAVQLAAAEQDPRVMAGDYELRLLRIPALYVVALWLKDRRGSEDLFRPIGSVQPPLRAGHVYHGHELERVLKEPAARLLGFDSRPKP